MNLTHKRSVITVLSTISSTYSSGHGNAFIVGYASKCGSRISFANTSVRISGTSSATSSATAGCRSYSTYHTLSVPPPRLSRFQRERKYEIS